MRYVSILGLLMSVACGGAVGLPEPDGGTDAVEDGTGAPGFGAAGTGGEPDASEPPEEPAGDGSRTGGALEDLMDRMRDQDAGREPEAPEPDAGIEPAPEDAGQPDAAPEPDPDAGITVGPGPGLCEPCEEDSWVDNYVTIYERGNCPEVTGGSIDTTGEVICYPHDDQGTYCVLKVLRAEQCDPYPGLEKDVSSDVIVGHCRPTGLTCAEWLADQGGA
jgi:hypothetical protein